MSENEISYRLRAILLSVHQDYGPGLLENIYEKILCQRIQEAGLDVVRQVPLYINEPGLEHIIAARLDLLVEGKVIVELKAVEEIHSVHRQQLYTYLKLTNLRLGLLVNFNVSRILHQGITRIVNNL